MTKTEFLVLLKRKLGSLIMISLIAVGIAAAMIALFELVSLLLPREVVKALHDLVAYYFRNPAALKRALLDKGASAPWFFILAQVLQVIFAPIPGQVVALAGGFVFGFWRGWLLTTLGLTIGSAIAMALARVFGYKLVRKIVPERIIKQFDSVVTNGGYMTFFMIFLLPALPDDAVCFLAGLTKLKLWRLSLDCLFGRAPGMIVLCLVGAGLAEGLTMWVQVLFAVMMAISFVLWIFWEVIEEKIYAYLRIKQ